MRHLQLTMGISFLKMEDIFCPCNKVLEPKSSPTVSNAITYTIGHSLFPRMQDEAFSLNLALMCARSHRTGPRQIIVWDVCRSEILHNVEYWFLTNISGQPVSPISKGQEIQERDQNATEVNWHNLSGGGGFIHPLIFKEAWQFGSRLHFSFQAKKCLTLWIT